MEEKRKSKRLPIKLTLKISDLFKQNNEHIGNIESPIEVFNISRTGLGFITKSELPLEYYFNAKIQLGNENSNIYTVIKIIRRYDLSDSIEYGCEFIGLAPVLDYIFEDYEKALENTEG